MPIATILAKRLREIQPPSYYVLEASKGIDVDFAASSFPVDAQGLIDHDFWHNRAAKKYNDFWKEFFVLATDEGRVVTKQQILDKLAEARSLYSVNNGL